ncbi:MAG: bifunctional alpha,alpha-trehalose-phosphate synthase (UDP-forming)/trehalose-phosphatase [bacterium]|jgi:trehalose 6-phosphate synthase/phosphatase
MNRLIIISNRLPVTIERQENQFQFKKSVGGLATGMSSVYRDYEGMWVGWSGLAKEHLSTQESEDLTRRLRDELNNFPVFLSRRDIRLFYEGFCNRTIWPLFHYFIQYTDFDKETWNAYQECNQAFLDAVLQVIQPGDIIWVHDYHLLLLPKMIRERVPDVKVGFFLHIPFPSSEVFRLLPWGKEILEGLLGADMIGFHTFDYVRHFMMSVRIMLGYENSLGRIRLDDRIIKVDAFPMGIDYHKFADAIQLDEVRQEVDRIREELGDRKLILSVDRLDYTKGIPERMEAYDTFLEKYPDYRGKVVLVMVAVPSRTKVPTYMNLRERVDRLVGRINGKYGVIGWSPVWYMYRSVQFPTLSALYYLSDVALITPLRDGMNLVAKEYLATKGGARQQGVLILSEMTGAFRELGEALIVNPNDREQIADTLHQAMLMPDVEKQEKSAVMQKRIKRYNVERWAEDFIERLQYTVQQAQEFLMSKRLSPEITHQILEHYKKSRRRLILLDYDGTLIPFVDRPEKAIPTQDLHRILDELSNTPGNEVVIISGRKWQNLEEWFGHTGYCLIAEHGVWIKPPCENWRTVEPMKHEWKEDVRPLLEFFVDRTPGSQIEEKDFSLAWHYRRADANLAGIRARELREALYDLTTNLNLGVMEGNKVMEIRYASITKGTATAHWITQHDYDFIIAFGDDVTDEDTFKALPDDAYTIKVRIESTSARYQVESVREVHRFLNKLIQVDL